MPFTVCLRSTGGRCPVSRPGRTKGPARGGRVVLVTRKPVSNESHFSTDPGRSSLSRTSSRSVHDAAWPESPRSRRSVRVGPVRVRSRAFARNEQTINYPWRGRLTSAEILRRSDALEVDETRENVPRRLGRVLKRERETVRFGKGMYVEGKRGTRSRLGRGRSGRAVVEGLDDRPRTVGWEVERKGRKTRGLFFF